MNKVNINQLIDMLSEYQEGELNDWGKMYLKDELLNLSHQLHDEDIVEGHKYDSLMVLIENGKEIPQPYKEFTVSSALSGTSEKVVVKEITSIRFNKDGNLVVELLGKKVK